MYDFLLNLTGEFWAKLITAFWYAALLIAILLLYPRLAGKGDFLYLNL